MLARPPHLGTFLALGAGLAACLALWLAPRPHESWLRSAAGNRTHAFESLPEATMLQAADSCGPGHFHDEEQYGCWVQDFQLALASPDAAAGFAALAERREPMAQLYGLAGLYLTDSAAFRRARARLEPRDTAVAVADGCALSSRPMREVAHEIESGYWPRALTRRRVDVH